MAFKAGQSEAAGGTFVTEGLLPTIQGGSNGSTQIPCVFAWDNHLNASVESHGPLMARGKSGGDRNGVVCITGDTTHALTHEGADASEDGTGRGTPVVLTFTPGDEARGEGPRPQQDLVQTLGANTQGDQAPHIICLASGQANAEVVRDGVPTLNTIHEQPTIVVTLDVHDSVKWGSHQFVAQNKAITAAGRPRRLTPLECERLMGWPDRHTSQGVREDGTAYALSDTARYRLCGNGVGTPVAAWIGKRLAEAHSL